MNGQIIERYILENLFQGKRRKAIGLDEPLVSSGTLDSLWMLRLIGFVEETTGLTISDGEVTPENFETIRKILDFIDRKTRVESHAN
jgi:acyl carrier protein